MSLSEFFYMGGYAFYVWTAYGIALVVLLFNAIAPLRYHQRLCAELARKLRLQDDTL